jgi:putative endonuclease
MDNRITNGRCVGEIDLIVLTEESLVFIEVKARKDLSEICNVITDTQWKRIEQAALWYLSQKFESIDLNIRFDAAFVSPGKDILFFHNAWMSQC